MLTLGGGIAGAQSLGDVARRERERRAALPQRARLITNEDLARRRILEPQSPEATTLPTVEPARPAAALPSTPAPIAPRTDVPLWKVAEQPGFSLGEYARRLREQRALREGSAPPASEVADVPATPQPAPHALPAPPPSAHAAAQPEAGFSLAEYARRLEAERRQRQRSSTFSVPETSEVAPTAPQTSETSSEPDPIRVRSGDSLWKLSFVFLGKGKLWPSLWKANPGIRDPNLIHPGQMLRWPDAQMVARTREQISEKSRLHTEVGSERGLSKVQSQVAKTNADVAVLAGMDSQVAGNFQLREKKPRLPSPSSPSSPSTIGSNASRSSTAERNSSNQGAVRS